MYTLHTRIFPFTTKITPTCPPPYLPGTPTLPPRVLFGSSHLYVFHHPKELAQLAKEGRAPKPVTYDFAQEEIAQEKGFDMSTKGKNIGSYIMYVHTVHVCVLCVLCVCVCFRMYTHTVP